MVRTERGILREEGWWCPKSRSEPPRGLVMDRKTDLGSRLGGRRRGSGIRWWRRWRGCFGLAPTDHIDPGRWREKRLGRGAGGWIRPRSGRRQRPRPAGQPPASEAAVTFLLPLCFWPGRVWPNSAEGRACLLEDPRPSRGPAGTFSAAASSSSRRHVGREAKQPGPAVAEAAPRPATAPAWARSFFPLA